MRPRRSSAPWVPRRFPPVSWGQGAARPFARLRASLGSDRPPVTGSARGWTRAARIDPSQAGKPCEFVVERDERSAVRHGQRREVCVDRQVASRTGLRDEAAQMAPMLVRLSHNPNRRLRKPPLDTAAGLLDRERSRKDSSVRAQPKEAGDDEPRETDRLITTECGLSPSPGCNVTRGRRVHGVEHYVEIDERHLRCSILRSVSRSSSRAAIARA